jgi:hypothetical protein
LARVALLPSYKLMLLPFTFLTTPRELKFHGSQLAVDLKTIETSEIVIIVAELASA